MKRHRNSFGDQKRGRIDPDETFSINDDADTEEIATPEVLFRLGPGLRKSKKGYGLILADDEGFTYNIANIRNKTCYWYCSERKKFNCDSRVRTAIPNITREELIDTEEHKIPGEIIKGHRYHEIQVGKYEVYILNIEKSKILLRNAKSLLHLKMTVSTNLRNQLHPSLRKTKKD